MLLLERTPGPTRDLYSRASTNCTVARMGGKRLGEISSTTIGSRGLPSTAAYAHFAFAGDRPQSADLERHHEADVARANLAQDVCPPHLSTGEFAVVPDVMSQCFYIRDDARCRRRALSVVAQK